MSPYSMSIEKLSHTRWVTPSLAHLALRIRSCSGVPEHLILVISAQRALLAASHPGLASSALNLSLRNSWIEMCSSEDSSVDGVALRRSVCGSSIARRGEARLGSDASGDVPVFAWCCVEV
ncbi:hypothetical protein KIPB_000689 [Kipferlia bialata]|uniref:Uncharacterized protein n=1 Tax=Kipferlia bialata TaxID=797122 RepID=A0A391NI85_9EUKA|nr:hypothetical protein KIPB_000689 [Kipferlia bialata]|eukprot:g689.t1